MVWSVTYLCSSYSGRASSYSVAPLLIRTFYHPIFALRFRKEVEKEKTFSSLSSLPLLAVLSSTLSLSLLFVGEGAICFCLEICTYDFDGPC